MWLDQLAKVTGICSALAIVIGAIYASIELRNNTRAVRAAAFQQVINSFAQISFEIANNRDLVELFLRGAKDFKSLNEVDRAQFSFMLLSFLRRAENVLFQSSSHVLSNEHCQASETALPRSLRLMDPVIAGLKSRTGSTPNSKASWTRC